MPKSRKQCGRHQGRRACPVGVPPHCGAALSENCGVAPATRARAGKFGLATGRALQARPSTGLEPFRANGGDRQAAAFAGSKPRWAVAALPLAGPIEKEAGKEWQANQSTLESIQETEAAPYAPRAGTDAFWNAQNTRTGKKPRQGLPNAHPCAAPAGGHSARQIVPSRGGGRPAAGGRTIHIIRLRPVRRPKGARPQGRQSGAPLPRPQDRMLACPVRGKAADPQIELRLRTRSNLAAPAVRAQFPHVQARTGRMPPPLPPENGPSTYNAGTKTHIKWDAPICRHETQEAPQAEEIKFKESWRFGPRRRRSERNRTSVVGSRPGRALWPKGRAGPRQGKSFARFHGPALRGRRAAGL